MDDLIAKVTDNDGRPLRVVVYSLATAIAVLLCGGVAAASSHESGRPVPPAYAEASPRHHDLCGLVSRALLDGTPMADRAGTDGLEAFPMPSASDQRIFLTPSDVDATGSVLTRVHVAALGVDLSTFAQELHQITAARGWPDALETVRVEDDAEVRWISFSYGSGAASGKSVSAIACAGRGYFAYDVSTIVG